MKMNYVFIIGLLLFGIGCSNGKIKQPETTGMDLKLAIEGPVRFEDYIHSLNIYAFRKLADNSYVYDRTMAELNGTEIADLQDASANGNSKIFRMNIPVGTYEIYMVGNIPGSLSAAWTEGVTTPSEAKTPTNLPPQDSVFFLGSTTVVVVTDQQPPVAVTLKRAVSKLVLVLYGVPVQIDSVSMSLGNLASAISLDGSLSGEPRQINRSFVVRKTPATVKDTIVGEIITLPSLAGGSPLQLTFYAGNGQEKVKDMPLQVLLPDKYLRVVGVISDNPGGLLSFEVNMNFVLVDNFLDKTLPDFVLNQQE